MAGSKSRKTTKSTKAKTKKASEKSEVKLDDIKDEVTASEEVVDAVVEDVSDDVVAAKDETIEAIDAEIVDGAVDGAGEKPDVETLDSETISENDDDVVVPPSGDSSGSGGFMAPGMILMGILALVAVGYFLSQQGSEDVAEDKASISTEVASETQGDQEVGADALVDLGDAAASDEAISDEVVSDDIKDVAENAVVEEVADAAASKINETVEGAAIESVEGEVLTPETATQMVEEAITENDEAAMDAAMDVADNVNPDCLRDDGTLYTGPGSASDPFAQTSPCLTSVATDAAEDAVAAVEEEVASVVSDVTDIQAPTATVPQVAGAVPNAIEQSATEPKSATEPNSVETQVADAPEDMPKTFDEAIARAKQQSLEAAVETTAAQDTDDNAKASSDAAALAVVPPAPQVDVDQIKSDVKADVMAEARELLEADNVKLEETSRELSALRAELDQALASQDRNTETRIAALEERIERIKSRDVAGATQQAAVSIALTNLQRQISTGRSFEEQLAILEKIAPTTLEMQQLKPFAKEGLPSLNYLQRNYGAAARKALASAKRADAKGPLGKLMANVGNLFSVRDVGHVEGDNPSAIIARAENFLEEGDVRASTEELAALEGAPKEAMQAWLDLAKARITAEALVDDISNNILAGIQ